MPKKADSRELGSTPPGPPVRRIGEALERRSVPDVVRVRDLEHALPAWCRAGLVIVIEAAGRRHADARGGAEATDGAEIGHRAPAARSVTKPSELPPGWQSRRRMAPGGTGVVDDEKGP